MKNIMFVCTGNICRSAMAEFLFKKKISERGLLGNVKICSAGTYAYDGDVPTYEGLSVMKSFYGIDMSNHKATPIRNADVQEMDLILCMTYSHKSTLDMMYPEIKNRIFLLKEYVNAGHEIDDPYGYGMDIYKSCAKEIDECLDLLLEKEFGGVK